MAFANYVPSARNTAISSEAMKLFALLSVCLMTACSARSGDAPASRQVAEDVLQIGRIEHPNITESSGIVWSRRDTNVFWTHNDGGGRKQVLYAITRTGHSLAEYFVTGAAMNDWEDIAADSHGHLFLGDIGNNDAKRPEIFVHQVEEPEVGKTSGGTVKITQSWRLRYPNRPFDSESLFVWAGNGYVISKVMNDAKAELFRFSLTNTAAQTLESVAQLPIDSPVTAADISPDGKLVAVLAKNGAYAFRIHGDPARILERKPHHTKFKHDGVEACTFVPEGLLVTSESREIYLFTDGDFVPKKK